jgi:tetratricopeptide (TPR) repeat protein
MNAGDAFEAMSVNFARLQRLKLRLPAFRFLTIRHYSKDIGVALALAIIAAIAIEPVWKAYLHHQRLAILRENLQAVAMLQVFDKSNKLVGQGSGFFITRNGLLVTNYHVVKGAANVVARLPSGAYYSLKGIRNADDESDIAVLQFDAEETPSVRKTGNSDLIQVGDAIYAIGTPSGFESSYSSGTVSNPSRKIGNGYFIQFTAPISPGSSGGGLFNLNGEVIGVTAGSQAILQTAERSERSAIPQNLNFAVPINEVKGVLGGQTPTLEKRSPAFYYSLGNLADNRKQWDKAIELYKQSLVLDPHYADAYIGLGGDYYETGEYQLEVQSYQKATMSAPDNPKAFYGLGSAYEEVGDYAKAIDAYNKVLSIDPTYKDAMYDLTIVYLAIGDTQKARDLLPRLMTVDKGWGKELQMLTSRVSK